MPSELKSETARANGAKSRGPTTAAGREKSSRNSLRHGFTSRSTIVLECEDLDEFKEMLADYKATYRPANAAESDLVDQMVAARWRIRIGWAVASQNGSHRRLRRPGWANYTFAFHDGDEVGPGLLAADLEENRLQPEDLQTAPEPDLGTLDTARRPKVRQSGVASMWHSIRGHKRVCRY